MSSNIFSVLNTAKLGLLSQQLAIEVVGQNIANVETEGYSRQEVTFEANTPRNIGIGPLGTGVRVSGIKRVHDQFLFKQIISEGDLTGEFRIRRDVFDQLEILFNENNGRSLNTELSEFFASFQDLSTNPTGLPERANTIAETQSLVSVFNQLAEQLFQTQRSIDLIIDDETKEINSLLSEIAKLNDAIHENEPGEVVANDLRDSRDRRIKELSEKIDLTLIYDSEGQINLTLKDGTPLVLRDTVFSLSTGLNGNNNAFLDVFVDDGAGGTKNVTSLIQGGELRGYLDMRDVELASTKDKLDRLAAGLVREINRVHQEGFGLDGSTGVDFFTSLSPTVFTDTNNTGSALVTMTNAGSSTTSVDKYEMVFTGTNTFTLNNQTTGLASGTFTFTSGSAFNLAGGFAVTITGSASTGDRFRFSSSENAAKVISVAKAVVNDSSKIAAGETGTRDGGNALDLADLQDSLLFTAKTLSQGSGAFTFDEFYNAIVSTIGIQSLSARAGVDQQEGILLLLDNRRESSAGVSIDEELIQLIRFQQAFNASARMIATVEEMFNVLLNQI